MRTATCRSTGYPPYRLLFGRDATCNLDLLFGSPPATIPTLPNTDYAVQLKRTIEKAHLYARQNMRSTILRQRRSYQGDTPAFNIGDLVWLFTPKLRPGQSKKFATYWTGPWTVSRQVNDLMYELAPQTDWARQASEIVSVDRLKRYYPSEEAAPVQPPAVGADLGLPGDDFAEMVEAQSDDDNEVFFPLPLPGAPPVNDPNAPGMPPAPPQPPGQPDPVAPPAAPAMPPPAPPAAPTPPALPVPAAAPAAAAPQVNAPDIDNYARMGARPRQQRLPPLLERGRSPASDDDFHSPPQSPPPRRPARRSPTTPSRVVPPRLTPTERERRRLVEERQAEAERRAIQAHERARRAARRDGPFSLGTDGGADDNDCRFPLISSDDSFSD